MDELTVEVLINKIKDKNDKVRTEAWQKAGKVGAPALAPLAEVVKKGELEAARSAGKAMWQIVRHAGRPGAEAERQAVVEGLFPLLADKDLPVQLRRDAAWMLSEIIKDAEFRAEDAARLLKDPDLREDVRAALIRVPGNNATEALQMALADASGDFKAALACALRARGVNVPEPPCPKLKPTRQTRVQPVGKT